jgi:HAMP domain-containing protein
MKCGEEYNSACCSDSGIPNHRVHRDFILYCKCLKIHRPAAIIINIVIILLIFRWVGMEVLSVFFAVLFILKEIAQYYLLWGLERRIMRPIATLKRGVGSIAKGDYSVRISNDVNNEIGVLIDEFNIMAEKLEQSEKIKVEYEENRKNLIANISHDLKTPITSISGYIEAILDGVTTEPDKINKYLKTIQSNIFYINNLIDDLFLFSKLDMQKLNFQFEKVNIKAFLADAMEEFKYTDLGKSKPGTLVSAETFLEAAVPYITFERGEDPVYVAQKNGYVDNTDENNINRDTALVALFRMTGVDVNKNDNLRRIAYELGIFKEEDTSLRDNAPLTAELASYLILMARNTWYERLESEKPADEIDVLGYYFSARDFIFSEDGKTLFKENVYFI